MSDNKGFLTLEDLEDFLLKRSSLSEERQTKLKEFLQESAETSRLNREMYMKKSQESQGRLEKHRHRVEEYLSQLP